ncbi:hypothetical protein ES703_90118 [subsurface metagenome]
MLALPQRSQIQSLVERTAGTSSVAEEVKANLVSLSHLYRQADTTGDSDATTHDGTSAEKIAVKVGNVH